MASGLILTAVGAEAIEAAYQAGEVVTIPIVVFGDGGGASVTPDPAVTKLVNKFGDVPFTQGESGSGMIAGQAVINARKHPGKVVREFGLMSSAGVLIAYGAYPDTYLPEQNDSIVKELVVNFAMPLVHAESVVLEIDPNISVLTIEEADGRYLQIKNALSEIAVAGPVA
ncbi:phage tail-collar fiber domain-containing protein, partial [Serratia marcescens]